MPVKCNKCRSDKLRPLFRSDTGEKWVGCDKCGNHSTSIVSNDRNEIIAVWDKENAKEYQNSDS